MKDEQIAELNSTHMHCVMLAKALITSARNLGSMLNDVYEDIPVTDNPEADEIAWAKLVHKRFGIPKDTALLLADFSQLPEIQSAPTSPLQSMPLSDALSCLAFLVPIDIPEDEDAE